MKTDTAPDRQIEMTEDVLEEFAERGVGGDVSIRDFLEALAARGLMLIAGPPEGNRAIIHRLDEIDAEAS